MGGGIVLMKGPTIQFASDMGGVAHCGGVTFKNVISQQCWYLLTVFLHRIKNCETEGQEGDRLTERTGGGKITTKNVMTWNITMTGFSSFNLD